MSGKPLRYGQLLGIQTLEQLQAADRRLDRRHKRRVRMRIGSYNYGTSEAFDTHGVPLGRFPDRYAAEKAMCAVRLPSSFWDAEEIMLVPLLRDLNDWVIKQNERRLPKWKFRFANNLAVQIQSRLTRTHDLLFEGMALQSEGATAKLFLEPKLLREQRYWQIKFNLFAKGPSDNWTFKPKGTTRGQLCPVSELLELRQRIIDTLHPNYFVSLRRDLMLSPNSLCCGKALTDPASMARWIGPECWGSASINLPRIFKTAAAA
jgi:hypothetical protein